VKKENILSLIHRIHDILTHFSQDSYALSKVCWKSCHTSIQILVGEYPKAFYALCYMAIVNSVDFYVDPSMKGREIDINFCCF
jgi:hypothetical protein